MLSLFQPATWHYFSTLYICWSLGIRDGGSRTLGVRDSRSRTFRFRNSRTLGIGDNGTLGIRDYRSRSLGTRD